MDNGEKGQSQVEQVIFWVAIVVIVVLLSVFFWLVTGGT